MGYSSEFLRGILSIISIAAAVALGIAAADELLGFGLFDGDYPGDDGFGGFAARIAGILVVSFGLSLLIDRLNG